VFDFDQEKSSLLGPWACAPISEDYTFGVEIEFVLHGSPYKGGVRFTHSNRVWESSSPKPVYDSLMDHLMEMGISEGWR
jgi:hypothetical protein